MKTLQNIDEIKRYPTVTNPIKADDLHTPQAYAYTLRRAIVTDCNDRQRAELVKLLEGKESAEGVTFNNTKLNRDRLHIWQNSESRKQRAAILGEGWQYIEGLNHGTQPGDVVCCVDGTRGRVTKSDPESCCIEFETADGRRLSVAGYFRYTPSAKSETAITEAEGVKVGDKVRHNKHEEVATVTAIREAFVNRADGYRYLYTLDFGQEVFGPFHVDLNGGEFLREAFTLYENKNRVNNSCKQIKAEPKVGSREWYREKLTGEWERETMYFEYFDVHHDSCVEVHKPTHDGSPTGDRWQTDITVWGDPTHDGTPRKEDAEPFVTFRTIDDLCKHLETLHVATMQLEDLTIESRNRLELERCTDRPTAWATDCTADDFEKLTSHYEVSDEDCDIVGRRFRFKPDDGLFNLSVFVADYAGNEAHALIYILDEFMGTVRANVLPIDKLRGILTEARGWQQAA